MKFSVPLTILAVAASVDAAAVADQEKRYCSGEGQACDTVKRAADAFSDALAANANLPTRAESGSEVASIAARQLRELALAIAASHGNPVAYFNALGYGAPQTDDSKTEKREAEPWCDQFLGGSCLAARDTSPAKRDAQAWCTQFPGMPCWKRSTPEQGVEEAKRDAQAWCTQFPGMPCWKRDGLSPAAVEARSPEAQAWCTQFPGMPCWKREVLQPSPVDKREPEPWCTQFPGMPCWKRDGAKATEVKREPEPWCTQFPGMPCWKREEAETAAVSRREAAPEAEAEPDRYCTRFVGSSCWKRDGSAAAADEVKRCETEGGACWQAKRAAMAVVNTIDHGNAVKMARDPQAWCTQFPGMPCWKRDAACNGPAGACTKATRDLHAIYNAARTIIEA